MGGGRFDPAEWETYRTTHVTGKTATEVFSTNLNPDLDPKGIKIRESCDSPDNPVSNAIAVVLDVSGSMGHVLEAIAKNLGVLVAEIYNKKPVTDPHLMFMAIDDVAVGNRVPLQTTQFEADMRIADQLTKIYFEQGGGGNDSESYSLAWYFAAMHTKIDCFEKRGVKGNIFTIGDEFPTPLLTAEEINIVLGYKPQKETFTSEELLDMVSKKYNVFHLIIEAGSNYNNQTQGKWTKLLGQRAMPVSDVSKIAEIIVSTLQTMAGVSEKEILEAWDKSTAVVVRKAIKGITTSKKGTGDLVRM
jgi:hypothetical protein